MNEIRLPTDMINIIKEFSFYNIEEVAKKNKEKVCRVILSAEYTRANGFNHDPTYSDNDENWCFGYAHLDSSCVEAVQLQATNCSVCGNYIHYCHDFNIKSIICHCWDQIHEEWNIEDLYSDDEEEEEQEEEQNFWDDIATILEDEN